MRCGDCKSPYVLCRCCPCHPVVKAKRGAVARLDKLITLKDSASSMYLIRKYQVGETDKSTRRLAPFTTCHVSFLPLKSNNFTIISVISLRPLTIYYVPSLTCCISPPLLITDSCRVLRGFMKSISLFS